MLLKVIDNIGRLLSQSYLDIGQYLIKNGEKIMRELTRLNLILCDRINKQPI